MTDAIENPDYFINREFTALAFNARVLQLAKDERIPLLERMRFLCICSGNLDEFFEIRMSSLKEKLALSSPKFIDGIRAGDLFSQLSKQAHAITDEIYSTFNKQLLPALRQERIYFLSVDEWSEDIYLWARHYFKNEILPVVSPIALDLAHPFPRLFNKSLNFIISLRGKDAFDRNIDYAVIHAPRSLPRTISLPSELCTDGGNYFVYLSSIIQTYVHRLFPGMEINGCYPFRLTRNSDLFLREEEIEDLAVAVQRELFSRHYGHVVRLEIDKHCPQKIVDFLLQKHHLHHEDAYYCDGPVNLQRYYTAINRMNRPDLLYPTFRAQYPPVITSKRHLFNVLDEKDILLHHPYQSYDVVIDFVRQAAADPNVLAIKQTLYRTHSGSEMVTALVEAARSGKEVTTVVELRARFDEESNLKLANRLHEAGVLVLYGVVGYKTHAKMTLVVRRTHGKLKQYAHLGTGNYHEQTSKLYTDFGLLTSDANITADIQIIFQQLTGLGRTVKLKALCHSPFTLQKDLLNHIEECVAAAKAGKESEINIKVNGLTDKILIKALYQASQAGVKINLIVRSLCCLKPGIPGISENIRVISILGRFLEHHRIYHFLTSDNEYVYCSSADLMERNLYNRIEILFPILDEENRKRVKNEIFKNYFKDNKWAWEMQADGTYKMLKNGQHSAQEKLLQLYTQIT
ncbi:polyphosphate kinase [Legionella beliardensis]|uniref:Polyphosphate kinase n=1 Tax=Legionella beliardensis TaxID=91822 RepID=A0A378HYE9_9GAMM|nr:polyphosphate kinase 1 [Legionella beliardensis]STX27723.1 polyphosphate kinase [Legionella beliardensis]